MSYNPSYECPRCGYKTHRKPAMYMHLYTKKKTCPQTKNAIELSDEIKEHILDNRIYNVTDISSYTKAQVKLNNELIKLKEDIRLVKFQKKEEFYQIMVEKYLNGKHLYLPSGITDVTTDSIHAEVKQWCAWKDSIGQLLCYNDDRPREFLHVYLFGKANKKTMQVAYDKFTKFGIDVYSFMTDGNDFHIVKYKTNEIVYTL